MVEIGETRARAELCQDDCRALTELVRKIPGASRRRSQRHDFETLMVDDPNQIPREHGAGSQKPA